MKVININYSEIVIKGRNRSEFERKLIENIQTALKKESYEKISKKETRILIFLNEKSNIEKISEKLKKIFGIRWFSFAHIVEKDVDQIEKIVVEESLKRYKGKTIKLETKRADKSFPMTSMELSKKIGQEMEKKGLKVDLENPDIRLYIAILHKDALVSVKRIEGIGGLPVGTAGKVLCLFSGGIDSPVAAWLMMKRGCDIDFIHFHPFPSNEKVKDSKIVKLLKELQDYSPEKFKLFIVPHKQFFRKTPEILRKYELVVFRRFIIKVANEIAKKENYKALVTGDNLAQVASQTLENLSTTNEASEIPIFRPLLTYDKEEIIHLARKIGTYRTSLEEYKDCCSLVAVKSPATKSKLEKAKTIEEKIKIDEVVEKTLKEIELI